MWVAVNEPLGNCSLSCRLTFLLMKQKMRALLLKSWVCIAVTYTSGYWHAVYMEMHTGILHIHKQTHTCCVSQTRHSQAGGRISQTHTHTHIPWTKGLQCVLVMNCCFCIIRMTHLTVINENRMKVLIKVEKCRHEEHLKTKRWSLWQEFRAVFSLWLTRT